MSEGIGDLPQAPENLKAVNILPTHIEVRWNFEKTSSDPVWFEVRYSETKENMPPHPLDYENVSFCRLRLTYWY